MISYTDFLPDRRLARRAAQLTRRLTALRTVSVSKLASTWAEQMAFYRLLANPRVRLEGLTGALTNACVSELSERSGLSERSASSGKAGQKKAGQKKAGQKKAGQKHLLLIQDTTELNFQAHAGRLQPGSGLGVVSDGESLGFLLHPTLALEAETGFALGFADVRCWARPAEAPDKRQRGYQRLPIEQKESYRWIEATEAARSGPLGEQAAALTIVADREADIYDLFARLPAGGLQAGGLQVTF